MKKNIRMILIIVLFAIVVPNVYAEEPSHHYFTTSDGIKIHYMTLGEKGSWVVLIHGYRDSAQRMWFSTGIAQELSKKHRVVALDNRNHGQSDKPVPMGPGKAEDVIELMDLLKIDKAHVHGCSMGGAITVELLAAVPDRFITAVIGGAGIMETDPELRKIAVSYDKPEPEPKTAEEKAFAELRKTMASRRTAPDTEGEEKPRPMLSGLSIDLSKITFPVMAINGEFDRPYAKTHRMWRELNNFLNVILPGKSHVTAIFPPSMPDEYLPPIIRFIDANDIDTNYRILATAVETATDLPGYNIYRPADLKSAGAPLPIIVWANGGCVRYDRTWKVLLERWAGAGFFVISIAEPASTINDPEARKKRSTPDDQASAIDWAIKANGSSDGPYAGMLDTDRIVATGNSCGGITSLALAGKDPRVRSVFILSGSSIGPGATREAAAVVMNKVSVPVGFVVGGSEDIAHDQADQDYDLLADGLAAMVASRTSGNHVTVSTDQEILADAAEIGTNWIRFTLYGDGAAKEALTGNPCGDCEPGLWSIKTKNLSSAK